MQKDRKLSCKVWEHCFLFQKPKIWEDQSIEKDENKNIVVQLKEVSI